VGRASAACAKFAGRADDTEAALRIDLISIPLDDYAPAKVRGQRAELETLKDTTFACDSRKARDGAGVAPCAARKTERIARKAASVARKPKSFTGKPKSLARKLQGLSRDGGRLARDDGWPARTGGRACAQRAAPWTQGCPPRSQPNLPCAQAAAAPPAGESGL
jgi:hypothetical protein